MTAIKAVPLWSTFLIFAKWLDHSVEDPGILRHLYQLKSIENQPISSGIARAAKTRGLFESKFNLFQSTTHPGLLKLKGFIEQTVQSSVAQINQEPDPASLNVVLTESWFHITNRGGAHDTHCHHSCSWCGIYYVQAGDPTDTQDQGPPNGANRFYSPLDQGGGYGDAGNQYLHKAASCDVTPENGQLVLFPSFLHHSALAYEGTQDRVVIAFNCQVIRK